MSKLIRFSAEELLKLTLPFGSVTSIQVTLFKCSYLFTTTHVPHAHFQLAPQFSAVSHKYDFFPSASQKTVKKGQAHAVVIYSDAEDAANAMKALNSITSFFEVSEIHTDQTSDYTYDWPPYFPQDDLDVWNSFNNQVMRNLNFFCCVVHFPVPRLIWVHLLVSVCQYLCLRIHNFPRRSYLRKLVYSLLPTSTIDVKVCTAQCFDIINHKCKRCDVLNMWDAVCTHWTIINQVEKKKKSALVMVPDYSAAYWLMDNLSGSLIGSEYIYISFAEEEAGKVFSTKPPRRRRYQQHRGAL